MVKITRGNFVNNNDNNNPPERDVYIICKMGEKEWCVIISAMIYQGCTKPVSAIVPQSLKLVFL